MKAIIPKTILLLLSLSPILAWGRAAQGPEQQRREISQRMQQKLKHAQNLIGSLAVEDFDALADQAESMRKIGTDSLLKVSPDLNYVKYGTEFTNLAEQLARRAKEKDLNGATLAYIRLTINCVDCHKFVRDERIFELKRREPRP